MKSSAEPTSHEQRPPRSRGAPRMRLAALTLLLLGTPTLAQAPQQGVIRITVGLVQIDAVVTDSKGRQVGDLKPEDFEVFVDGRPQKITNFSYVVLQAPSPTPSSGPQPAPRTPYVPPAPLRREDVRRTIALVVDDLGLSFESTAHLRGALKEFVDEQTGPGDLVAILRTAGGVGPLQEFTSDKRLLYAAIEHMRWRPWGRGGIGAFAPIEAGDPLSSQAPGGRPRMRTSSLMRRLLDQRETEFREDIFAAGTLGAIQYVVRGMRSLPGRKSVILLSDGIPIRLHGDYFSRVLDALRRLIDDANRSSVVIYAVDARGLMTTGATAEDDTSELFPGQVIEQLQARRDYLLDSQAGMAYLAEETGGYFIKNTNDLSGGVGNILGDLSAYYLIGFKPPPETFRALAGHAAFHKIKVKLNVPGLRIRYRKGFLGIPDEESPPVYKTRDEQMLAALSTPFSTGAVRLRLTPLFRNDAQSGSIVSYLLHIDARDLTFVDAEEGMKKTVVEILALTFGDNGAVADSKGKVHTVRMKPAQAVKALKDGILYTLDVPVKKPGAYQLRIAVRDQASERVGSASQFIDVPDVTKGWVALSGILLQAPGTPQAGDDAGSNPVVRKFLAGSELHYGYQIYDARLDKRTHAPQVETHIEIFHDGKSVYSQKPITVGAVAQPDLARLAVGGKLQLGAMLDPGDYILQATATDHLAKEKYATATQWIDFEVNRSEPPPAP